MNRTHACTQTLLAAVMTTGVLGAATVAQAQSYEVTTSTAITYVPLSDTATVLSMDSDDDEYTISTPFPIYFYSTPFFAESYDEVRIGDNGAIFFGAPTASINAGNATPGSPSTPNNWIAPLWDDLRIFSGTGSLQYETAGTAPNRTFSVEWERVGLFGGSNAEATFKVVFYEGDTMRIDVMYGDIDAGSGNAYSATMALEDAEGGNVINLNPAACGSTCGSPDVEAMANSLVTVRPTDLELTGQFVAAPRGALPGEIVTTTVALLNFGPEPAVGARSELWLSADSTFDEATDVRVFSTIDDLNFGATTVTATASVPPVPAGDYFVFLRVDTDDLYTEANELDNEVLSPLRFATAPDFVTTNIEVLTSAANAGDTVEYQVTIGNTGAPYVGPLTIEMRASADTTYTPASDPSVAREVVNMNGMASQTFTLSGTLPTVPAGEYFSVALIDPSGIVPELDTTNNEAISDDTFDSGADFAVGALTVPNGIAPGSMGTFVTRIDNLGVAYTGDVRYQLFASEDDELDTTMDTSLGSFDVTFAGEAERTDTRSITFPMMLAPNRYFIFAVVDSNLAVVESDENNNEAVADNQLVNAFDFTPVSASISPTTVEVNDQVTVTVTFNNEGLPFTGNIPIAVVLSSDDMFDPGDQAIFRGFAFFPNAPTTGPQTFTFPVAALPGEAQLRPGGYTIFVAIDPNDLFDEAEEENNAVATGGGSLLNINGADLLVVDLTTESPVFIGSDFRITLEVENDDIADARGFRYAYYLSDNRIIRTTDDQIWISGTTTVAAGAIETFTDVIPVPPDITSSTAIFLGVILDIFSQVPERTETNNTRTSDVLLPDGTDLGTAPIDILIPIPDLQVEIISTPTVAAAGEDIALTRLLSNTGVAAADNFTYSYYLSSNPTISAVDDILIFTGTATLAAGTDDYGIDILTLPADLSPANYYVGAIVDPNDEVDEILEDNNAFTGPQIPVFPTTIQFTTRELPDGIIGVEYEAGVYASGAPLELSFEVSEGQLPGGLELDGQTGILSGTPMAEGVFEFTVRAFAGTAFAEQEFVVRITSPTVDIRIATNSLPGALVGRDYSAQMVAVGGQPPYTWSTISELPTGVTLSESGLLAGTPETPSIVRIVFQVVDDLGQQATRELELNIVSGLATIQIQQDILDPGEVNISYCEQSTIQLRVRNGAEPFTWSIIGDAPPGMNLAPNGEFCGTPTEAGRFPFTVRVQDSTGAFDTSLFLFAVNSGSMLSIQNFGLPDGDEGEPYLESDQSTVTLTAIQGTEPYTWSLVDGAGQLPEGLTLSSNGEITGTPTEGGTFAFLIQVTDTQLRTDIQPLSLLINPIPPPPADLGDDGCSCSATQERNTETPWASLAVLAAIGAFFGLRRRRRWLLVLLAGTQIVAATSVVEAQSGPEITVRRETATYVGLANATVLATNSDDSSYTVTSPFPISYYGNTYTTMQVGDNGMIQFPGTGQFISLSNQTPGSSSQDNWVAPVWDDLRIYTNNMARLGWAVQGTAPNRTLTIEYRDISRFGSTGTTMNFQVVFFEGPVMRINVNYGAMNISATMSATMGMEDSAGGRPIQFAARNCNTSCNATDITGMANRRVVITEDAGPDLSAAGLVPPNFAFVGAQNAFGVDVFNLHGNPIGPFSIAIEASQNEDFSDAQVIGTSGGFFASPFTIQTFNVIGVPPLSFGTNPMFVRAIVDPADDLVEVNEGNNEFSSDVPVRLLEGAPDLAVERVTVAGTEFDAGDTLDVIATIRNVGSDPANDTAVRVLLSGNPVISRQDVQLSELQVSLDAGEATTATVSVTIPAGTNSGTYYFGALADPEDELDELNDSNNARATFEPVTVIGASLAITTQRLPSGTLRVPYVAQLQAVGTSADAVWFIEPEDLPLGLGLVPNTGEIFGRPVRAEMTTFTVELTSNGETVTRQLTLSIVDPQEPLTIVSRNLPQAVVGQEYSFPLVVTGGSSADGVTWMVTGLPDGFSIDDQGVINGTPTAPGNFVIEVTATAGGETTQRTLQFQVLANPSLLIVPEPLGTATYGQSYTAQIQAQGGLPPYTFLVASGSLPDGLSLNTSGEISGEPQQVGQFRFVVEARDAGTGARSARDQNAFVIEVLDNGAFSVATESLPFGVIDIAYEVSVSATGGRPPYTWSREGRLPDGLIDEEDDSTGDYVIRGQPTAPGISNLLLTVRDSEGRVARRAFALEIFETDPTPAPPLEDDGGSGAAAFGLLLLGLVGLAVLRNRN